MDTLNMATAVNLQRSASASERAAIVARLRAKVAPSQKPVTSVRVESIG